jgi:hypothetical protein
MKGLRWHGKPKQQQFDFDQVNVLVPGLNLSLKLFGKENLDRSQPANIREQTS